MDPINIAWRQTVDHERFECRVEQPNKQVIFDQPDGTVAFDDQGTIGRLIVKVVADNKIILDEDTPITAGAIFGSDVDDVAHWQSRCIKAIDEWLVQHGESIPPPTATDQL